MTLKYVPGMPWKLDEDGIRVPDEEAIRACPFPSPYTMSQLGARPRVRCDPDSSLTQQEFKDECDINTIMRRYVHTGRMPALLTNAQYGDFSEVPEYMEALNQVLNAQHLFGKLPSNLRDRFGHDPGKLLQFLSDKNNKDEAIALGLIPTPPPTQNTPGPNTAPANPAAANATNPNDAK
ncbi:internal scaffolding protein [Chifec microvirus UA13_19]|nr:internal scaffolding protein [Chifec microvirus UA13_19]